MQESRAPLAGEGRGEGSRAQEEYLDIVLDGLDEDGTEKHREQKQTESVYHSGQSGPAAPVVSAPASSRRLRFASHGVVAVLAGADPNHVIEGGDKDLAVADLAGMGLEHDRFNRRLRHLILDDQVDLQLGQEVNDILGAPVHLGMALLSAEAFHLVYGETGYTDGLKLLLHGVQGEGFDNCFDLFHLVSRSMVWTVSPPERAR